MTGTRPAGRFEWEQAVLRGRWSGIIKGNGAGTRGGVSGAVFRAVAWALASHADPDGGNLWPGDSTVAALSEVGLKNVRAVRATLVEFGFLEKVRVGARRLGGADVFRLTVPQGAPVQVPTLSAEGVKAEARRLSDSGSATFRKSKAFDASEVQPSPADLVQSTVEPSPVDPVKPVVVGPLDPVQKVSTGSSGPANRGLTGSKRTVEPGPVDRYTNHDQAKLTNQQDRAPDSEAISPTSTRRPESLSLILDTLADEQITEDEARAVMRAFATAAKPRGIGLYRTVAEDGGIQWRTALADLRTAAKAEAVNAVAELRRQPRCPHGEPGGDQPHPIHGHPLCPLCRRGVPTPATSTDPDPVETYRRLHRATHGEPGRDLMTAVARQRIDLAARGASLPQLQALAAAAACAGHDLVAHLRTESDRASA